MSAQATRTEQYLNLKNICNQFVAGGNCPLVDGLDVLALGEQNSQARQRAYKHCSKQRRASKILAALFNWHNREAGTRTKTLSASDSSLPESCVGCLLGSSIEAADNPMGILRYRGFNFIHAA